MMEQIIGRSESIFHFKQDLVRAAKEHGPFLILGEQGSGKSLAAQALAQLKQGKKINSLFCPALTPDELESGFEKSDILILIHLEETPPPFQAIILKFMRKYPQVVIISTSSPQLKKLVDEKKFRSDLYYELQLFPFSMPTLEARKDDIALLVESFLTDQIKKIDDSYFEVLMAHHFHGNIKELKNIVLRSLLLAEDGILSVNSLPVDLWQDHTPEQLLTHHESQEEDVDISQLALEFAQGHSLKALIDQYEKEILSKTLAIYADASTVAKKLGISRSSLYLKISKHGLK